MKEHFILNKNSKRRDFHVPSSVRQLLLAFTVKAL